MLECAADATGTCGPSTLKDCWDQVTFLTGACTSTALLRVFGSNQPIWDDFCAFWDSFKCHAVCARMPMYKGQMLQFTRNEKISPSLHKAHLYMRSIHQLHKRACIHIYIQVWEHQLQPALAQPLAGSITRHMCTISVGCQLYPWMSTFTVQLMSYHVSHSTTRFSNWSLTISDRTPGSCCLWELDASLEMSRVELGSRRVDRPQGDRAVSWTRCQ